MPLAEVEYNTVTMVYCRGCNQSRLAYVKWYTGYSQLYCSKVPWAHIGVANI